MKLRFVIFLGTTSLTPGIFPQNKPIPLGNCILNSKDFFYCREALSSNKPGDAYFNAEKENLKRVCAAPAVYSPDQLCSVENEFGRCASKSGQENLVFYGKTWEKKEYFRAMARCYNNTFDRDQISINFSQGAQWIHPPGTPQITEEERDRPAFGRIFTTSTLEPKKLKYAPYNLIDGTEDSWCEGNKDNGENVQIEIDITDYRSQVGQIYLKNGYGNPKYYATNNRIKDLKYYTDARMPRTITLKDTPEFQAIDWPTRHDKRITLVIQSVYPGTKGHDTCLAEVAFEPGNLAKAKNTPVIKKSVMYQYDGCDYYFNSNGEISAMGAGCHKDMISAIWFLQGNGEVAAMEYYGITDEGGRSQNYGFFRLGKSASHIFRSLAVLE